MTPMIDLAMMTSPWLTELENHAAFITNIRAAASLLRRNSAAAATQDVFLDFAGSSLWKFRHEVNAVRCFEMGEMLACKFTKFFFGRGRSVLQHYKRVRRFSPTFVRQTHDRDF